MNNLINPNNRNLLFIYRIAGRPGVKISLLLSGCFIFFYLLGASAFEKFDKMNSLNRETSRYRNRNSYYPLLLDSLRIYHEKLEKFKIFTADSANLFFDGMLARCQQENLQVTAWRIGRVKKEKKFQTVDISVSVNGNVRNILNFLSYLENRGNPLIAENLKFTGNKERRNVLFSLKGKILFR
jgi:hypothetical protein